MTIQGERREQIQRATERGEGLRRKLLSLLEEDGEQSAALLVRQLPPDVSLSEVAFQLCRLAEEGQVEGEVGGYYRRS
jgi:hypothetical protein